MTLMNSYALIVRLRIDGDVDVRYNLGTNERRTSVTLTIAKKCLLLFIDCRAQL